MKSNKPDPTPRAAQPRSGRVSMEDVARAAGVHRSTVSLALRNQARIPAATRQRIHEIAAGMGYAPDPLLDAFNFHRLATHPTRASPVIAFISDQPSRAAFNASAPHRQAFAGAKERAARMGFRLDVFLIGRTQLSAARLDQVLQSRSISCVIVGLLGPDTADLRLDWSRYCVIAIDSFHVQPALDVVSADYRAIGRLAARRLHEAGHSRIGFVTTAAEDRRLQHLPLAGFLLECAREATVAIPPLLLPGEPDADAAVVVAAWVRRHRVAAIVAGCLPVADALRADLFRVSPAVAWSGVTDTGLDPGYEALGARAAELLPLRQQASQRGMPLQRTTMVLPTAGGG